MPKSSESSRHLSSSVEVGTTSKVAALKSAFRNLGNLSQLETCSFVTHPWVRKISGQHLTAGQAVRDLMLTALNRLKPDLSATPPSSTDPAWLSPEWMPYLLLTIPYINHNHGDRKLSTMQRIACFRMSNATYYRQQTAAFTRLSYILDELAAEAQAPDPTPWISTNLPLMPTQMMGRDTLLNDLQEHLSVKISMGCAPTIAIWGTPGMGKTTFLAALAHDEKLRQLLPDGTLWASAGDVRENQVAQLITWAKAVGVQTDSLNPNVSIDEIKQAINIAMAGRKMLMLVDDIWNSADLDLFRLGGPQCALIFATRQVEATVGHAIHRAYQLEHLNEETSKQLLLSFAPMAETVAPDRFARLVSQLGGWPLAIQLAGSQLRPPAQRGQFRRLREALDELLSAGHDDVLNNIIASSVSRLPAAAQATLMCLSLFPAKPFTFLESAAIAVSEGTFADIDLLVGAGLLETRNAFADSGINEDRYTVHQSIIDFARQQLESQSEAMVATVLDRFIGHVERMTRSHRLDYPRLQEDLEIAYRTLALTEQYNMPESYACLVLNLSPFLQSHNQCLEVVRLLEIAWQANQPEDIPEICFDIAFELSQAYFAQRDLLKAEECAEVALSYCEDIHQSLTAPNLPIIFEILARAAQAAGDTDAAGQYARRAIAAVKNLTTKCTGERQLLIIDQLTLEDMALIHEPVNEQPTSESSTLADIPMRIMQLWQQVGQHYIVGTDLPATKAALLEALKLSRLLNDPAFLSNTLGFLTIIHATLAEYDAAIATCNETLTYGLNPDFPRGYAFAIAFGTLSHLHRNQIHEAKQLVQMGRTLAEKGQSAEALAWICFAAASYDVELGNLPSAEQNAQLSLSYCQQIHAHDSLATMLGLCGRVATARGNFKAANDYLQQAQSQAFNDLQRYYALADLGIAAQAKGDFQEAQSLLQAAYEFHATRGATRYVPLISHAWANALSQIGQQDQAIIVATRALQQCRDTGDANGRKLQDWLRSI